jgi:hypothetical protein
LSVVELPKLGISAITLSGLKVAHVERMLLFRSVRYPTDDKPFKLLQEFAAKPFLGMLTVWGAYLYLLLARHEPLFWPALLGLMLIVFLANLLGLLNLRRTYVQVSFQGEFFYIASVYDIAFRKQAEYYPLQFANAFVERSILQVNYKGQFIPLRREEWPEWDRLHEIFKYGLPPSDAIE